jgi:hypothetical protein
MTIGRSKEGAGPCSLSQSSWLSILIFFLFNTIKELINIILVLKRITKHIKVRRLSSSPEAMFRRVSSIIKKVT